MLHFSLSEAICSKILLWVLYFQRKIVLTNKALRELKGWHYFGKNHYVSESTAQRGNSHIKTRTSQFLNDDLTLPRFAGSTSNLECQHINFQWQTHLSHQPKGMLAQGINDQNATIKRCSGASKRSIPGYVAQIFKSPSWRSALTDPGKVKYIREQKPPWCRLKGHCSIFSSLLIFIMYVCVCVHTCTCMCHIYGSHKKHWIPWSRNYSDCKLPLWALRNELASFRRTRNTLNHWTSFPVPITMIDLCSSCCRASEDMTVSQ